MQRRASVFLGDEVVEGSPTTPLNEFQAPELRRCLRLLLRGGHWWVALLVM